MKLKPSLLLVIGCLGIGQMTEGREIVDTTPRFTGQSQGFRTHFGFIDAIAPKTLTMLVDDTPYQIGPQTRYIGPNGQRITVRDLTVGTPVYVTTVGNTNRVAAVRVLSESQAETVIRKIQEKEPWRFR